MNIGERIAFYRRQKGLPKKIWHAKSAFPRRPCKNCLPSRPKNKLKNSAKSFGCCKKV